MLNIKSPKNIASKKIFDFLKNVQNISYFKYISEINFSSEDKLEFIKEQKKFYDFHNLLCSKASNIELIFITKEALNNDNIINLSNLIQYIITNCQNSDNQMGLHLIRIIKLKIENENNEEEIEEENNIEENNEEINEENKDVFILLDKFIQIILYLLKEEKMIKKRKLIIEYYNVTDIELPKTEIENNKKIEKLITDKNEIFINNLQEKDIEDTDAKANTIYTYTRQKLVYEWFINDIIKLKIIIIFVLDIKLNYNKNALFNKLNNKGKEDIKKAEFDKIKKIIFSYIFPENSNKYFYTRYINENPKKTAAAFEKLIFE